MEPSKLNKITIEVGGRERDITSIVNNGAALYAWLTDGRAAKFQREWMSERGLTELTPEQKKQLASDMSDAIMASSRENA